MYTYIYIPITCMKYCIHDFLLLLVARFVPQIIMIFLSLKYSKLSY